MTRRGRLNMDSASASTALYVPLWVKSNHSFLEGASNGLVGYLVRDDGDTVDLGEDDVTGANEDAAADDGATVVRDRGAARRPP